MAAIVLKIPTGPKTFVKGDCLIDGYEGLILCKSVSYEVSIQEDLNAEGRRTVHSPEMSVVSIERDFDPASVDIARMLLGHGVSVFPWEIYMLRVADGVSPAPAFMGPGASGAGSVMVCYLKLKLHRPVVTKQQVSAEEGGMVESIDVSAAAVEWRYLVLDDRQAPVGGTSFRFNLQTGTVD